MRSQITSYTQGCRQKSPQEISKSMYRQSVLYIQNFTRQSQFFYNGTTQPLEGQSSIHYLSAYLTLEAGLQRPGVDEER